jgi:hypothetical protein
MNPSVDLRIRSMLRALTQVVIPALDARDALAQEQARLLVGHLHALSLQCAHEARFVALEDRAMRRLGQALLAASGGGPVTRTAAAGVRESLEAPDGFGIGSAIDRLILAGREDGSPSFRDAVARLTLAHGRAAALRGRSWFAAMGFGGDPARLPSIGTMLDQFSEQLERDP